MIKILFVCHGNICRSPMAEFVMKDMVKRAGIENEFQIDSAATSAEEIGNNVYPPARRKMMEHGIEPYHRAVQMKRADYEKYDYIIGMDISNIHGIMRICGGDPDGKIYKLLDFAGGGNISDPWYSGDFESTWRDINAGCTALLKKLERI